MHTPDCNDSLDYWPEGAGTDVDVSTLPAADAITGPRRIPGQGKWLAFWGPSFSGLRVGYSPTRSYPVINGLAVPYPEPRGGNLDGLDLFLSRDTGGTGTVTIARFPTEAAARAWAGRPTPSTSSGPGSSLTPSATMTVSRVTGIVAGADSALLTAAAGRLGVSVQCTVAAVSGVILSPSGGATGINLAQGQAWEPPPGLRYTGALQARGQTGETGATVEIQTYT